MACKRTVNTMADLKPCPCPHCGEVPREVVFKSGYGFSVHQVQCFSCKTKPHFGGRGFSEQKAIEKWNRQVDEWNSRDGGKENADGQR